MAVALDKINVVRLMADVMTGAKPLYLARVVVQKQYPFHSNGGVLPVIQWQFRYLYVLQDRDYMRQKRKYLDYHRD